MAEPLQVANGKGVCSNLPRHRRRRRLKTTIWAIQNRHHHLFFTFLSLVVVYKASRQNRSDDLLLGIKGSALKSVEQRRSWNTVRIRVRCHRSPSKRACQRRGLAGKWCMVQFSTPCRFRTQNSDAEVVFRLEKCTSKRPVNRKQCTSELWTRKQWKMV